MSAIRGFSPAPGSIQNGLPEHHDYAYRGELTLEAELPFECAGGCGRRLETDRWPLCAVCRDSGGVDLRTPEEKQARGAGARPRR